MSRVHRVLSVGVTEEELSSNTGILVGVCFVLWLVGMVIRGVVCGCRLGCSGIFLILVINIPLVKQEGIMIIICVRRFKRWLYCWYMISLLRKKERIIYIYDWHVLQLP